MQNDLTSGSVLRRMLSFSVPYMLSCFLQTFYGLADLMIAGRFNGADVITAVSVGSQVMHMLTVVVVGLTMGTTVCISRSIGAGKQPEASRFIGNTFTLFSVLSVVLTATLLLLMHPILRVLSVPAQSFAGARQYLTICFAGIPCIVLYNVVSAVYRGLGDTRTPLLFIAVAGVLNVVMDIVLIGRLHMGASGAAAATVTAQAVSVLLAGLHARKRRMIQIRVRDLHLSTAHLSALVTIGVPVAIQEGLIQISFLVITAIVNRRGVDAAAAVGIVEKLISFLFLVPLSMLSTVSAFSAQNGGAGEHTRSKQSLRYGVGICILYGILCAVVCNLFAEPILSLFTVGNAAVIRMGAQYLHAYAVDCILAGVHFCFSGFFSAYGKSGFSFLHNILSAVCVRIPASYAASVRFPQTLFPMGLAAPLGSLLSVVLCVFLYFGFKQYWLRTDLRET